MSNCVVSQLDNNVRIGSKVKIADNSGNSYSGYVTFLNHKDGRITLKDVENLGRYECGTLHLWGKDIKESTYDLIFLYIQVFLWVKFLYRNFNSYKVKVTDKTDSMYSSNSSFSQNENVQVMAQPPEMGHIKKMYIVDYDTAESVRKFAWFKIVLDLKNLRQ